MGRIIPFPSKMPEKGEVLIEIQPYWTWLEYVRYLYNKGLVSRKQKYIWEDYPWRECFK